MSAGGATSEQVISLPKGGGALRGIGEKFSPDLHTGTGNFSVPLDLQKGRGGFQPKLSLAYSTGSPNGPFGLGWALSVPGVRRKTSRGIPTYDDRDTFVLSGAEDLVRVAESPDGFPLYRPRAEGLFARIMHVRAGEDDFWEVRTKDGLVSVYGMPAEPPADWSEPPVVADPQAPAKVFAWHLSLTTDPFGNRIEYLYERDRRGSGSRRWDQLYVREIRYVDHGTDSERKFLVSVKLVYEERPDAFSDCRAGFEVRTARRCRRIEISTDAEQRLVRTYHFRYCDDPELEDRHVPANGVSLLAEIQVEGHDETGSDRLPPLRLGYTRFEPQTRRYRPFSAPGGELPPRALASKDYDLVDLFGNGLPSVLELNGGARYWRNLGGGRFDRPRSMASAPAGVKLADPGVQIADLDGDSRPDLLVTDGRRAGYFSLARDGTWDTASFRRYEQAPAVSLDDPEVRLVDLDGDGVTDALRTGESFELYYSDRERGWDRVQRVTRGRPADFPDVSFSDPRVKLAGMTGDGLQSIVLVHDGRVDYWPYMGRGRWGARITMSNSPRLRAGNGYGRSGFDPQRVLLADVDDDGCADLVHVESGRITVWINRCGNGWSDPITVHGTPLIADVDSVRVADMDGTGPGILWTYDLGRQRDSTFKFLDLTGETKPSLLTRIENRMGAVTDIEYASSTRFFLEDERRPETRWKTNLPFPVQVVARVVTSERFSHSKLTTEYAYHHGHWDGVEQEFRGFGRVDQRDTESFHDFNAPGDGGSAPVPAESFSPPTELRTWFHLGAVGGRAGWEEIDLSGEYWKPSEGRDEPLFSRSSAMNALLGELEIGARRDAIRTLAGRTLRSELYGLDGSDRAPRPYTVTEHAYEVSRVEPLYGADIGGWRDRVFLARSASQRTTEWDRGRDPMTSATFTPRYDRFGQPTLEVRAAVPRGRDPRRPAEASEPYLVTATETVFALRDEPHAFLADRPAQATTREIGNDGRLPLVEVARLVADGAATGPVLDQTLTFYDGGDKVGAIDSYGAATATESLVLTPALVERAYGNSPPPYLAVDPPDAWPEEYPEEFRRLVGDRAGYVYRRDGPGETGHYARTEQRFDFQDSGAGARGLVVGRTDARGNWTRVEYDRFGLLPTRVSGPAPASLAQKVDEYDYRVLAPSRYTDENGNVTLFRYQRLGLLASVTRLGKEDAAIWGDKPSELFAYAPHAFHEEGQPVWAHFARREEQPWELVRRTNEERVRDGLPPLTAAEIDALFPADEHLREPGRFVESRVFSDGSGRVLQTRTKADAVLYGEAPHGGSGLPLGELPPGDAVASEHDDESRPRVVVSGWQVYDNKARVVEAYEPFFDLDWGYRDTSAEPAGQKVVTRYDARGRVVKTIRPDGSFEQVVHGVPGTIDSPELTSPASFEPTPWLSYTYDANDNAARTPGGETVDPNHLDTPSSSLVDPLGRVVEAVERNGRGADAAYVTRSTFDIQGNVLTVTDAASRLVVSSAAYDLARRQLAVEQLDAGRRLTAFDAAGNAVETRDAKGAAVFSRHDELDRRTHVWARDRARTQTGSAADVTLRERLVFGDAPDGGLPRTDAQERNLLGQPFRAYDEAGLLEHEHLDHQGNVLRKIRRAIADDAILAAIEAGSSEGWSGIAFRVDWTPPDGVTLEQHAEGFLEPAAAGHVTTTAYDALSRPLGIELPADVEGAGHVLEPAYNRAGALVGIRLDGADYVKRIAYNARGERILIAYGNGLMTRYAYDPATFRLSRLRSEPCEPVEPDGFRSAGAPLQDLTFEYDLVGNVTRLRDRTPGCGLPTHPDELDRELEYDPLYRLVAARHGRECGEPTVLPPWAGGTRCTDLQHVRAYDETYAYDETGNLLRLEHTSAATRRFELVLGSNRLSSLHIGETAHAYAYDECGNLVREHTERMLEWDHANRLQTFRTQAGDGEPSVYAQYLYDATGQRVKKLVRKSGEVETTVYVDGVFETRAVRTNSGRRANTTVHVVDNTRRIAERRYGEALEGDPFPDVAAKYHLADHLGSSTVVVDATRQWLSREEYTPYGETSFGGYARKRYRFTGKERDEESGLSYHGARYYAPWAARWVSCDPAGHKDGLNLYRFCRSNPLTLVDPSGRQADAPKTSHEYRGAVHATPGTKWESERGKHAEAKAKGSGVSGGPYEQHHHADIKSAEHTGLSPDIAGEPERMSTVHSAKDPVVRGEIEGRKGPLTHHGTAAKIGEAEKARVPSTKVGRTVVPHTPEGLIDASGTAKWRWPATADYGERAKQKWTPSTPAGPEVDVKTGRVIAEGSSGWKAFGKGALEVLATKGGKFLAGPGTAIGVGLAASEARAGNYAAAFVELAGASEVPIVAQVADAASLAADITWVAKEAFDPEQKVEQWWYKTFLR